MALDRGMFGDLVAPASGHSDKYPSDRSSLNNLNSDHHGVNNDTIHSDKSA